MQNKTLSNFVFGTIALILGWTLYKQFDLETVQFENNGLAIVYFIALIVAISVIIRNSSNQDKKQ